MNIRIGIYDFFAYTIPGSLYLFPLLEVNFVRYKRYTVYPFPFSLIRMWNYTVIRVQTED